MIISIGVYNNGYLSFTNTLQASFVGRKPNVNLVVATVDRLLQKCPHPAFYDYVNLVVATLDSPLSRRRFYILK
jgi:hypothetical protein